MKNNPYIQYINQYITNNTPVEFIFLEKEYQKMTEEIHKNNLSLSDDNTSIICASYSLFYTSLAYHKLADMQDKYQPYYILIGDYISSYVVELLYKNQMYHVLKVFAEYTKELMLNILNQVDDDRLLEHLILALKK